LHALLAAVQLGEADSIFEIEWSITRTSLLTFDDNLTEKFDNLKEQLFRHLQRRYFCIIFGGSSYYQK